MYTMTRRDNDPPFWGGMIEGATPLLANRFRLDSMREFRHTEPKIWRQDCEWAIEAGLGFFRLSGDWSRCAHIKGEKFEFGRYRRMLEITSALGISTIWNLTQYSYPEWLDSSSPNFDSEFIMHFVLYAVSFVKMLRTFQPRGTLYICPFNEIGFWCYKVSQGHWAPFGINADHFKEILIRATIAAIRAILAIDKNVRFIQVEPILRRTAQVSTMMDFVKGFNPHMFTVWDALYAEFKEIAKRILIIGANWYFKNDEDVFEAEDGSPDIQMKKLDDPDRVRLVVILQQLYERYNKDCELMLAEFGAHGDVRKLWIPKFLPEIVEAATELPMIAACYAPAHQTKWWDYPYQLTYPGLWDSTEKHRGKRIPHEVLGIFSEFVRKHPMR